MTLCLRAQSPHPHPCTPPWQSCLDKDEIRKENKHFPWGLNDDCYVCSGREWATMLRADSWCFAQGALLVGLRKPPVMPGMEPGSALSKASFSTSVLSLWPNFVRSFGGGWGWDRLYHLCLIYLWLPKSNFFPVNQGTCSSLSLVGGCDLMA